MYGPVLGSAAADAERLAALLAGDDGVATFVDQCMGIVRRAQRRWNHTMEGEFKVVNITSRRKSIYGDVDEFALARGARYRGYAR